MVAKIQEKGVEELHSFKKRVLNVCAIGRISKADADNLVKMVNDLEAYVLAMPEKPFKTKDRNLW